MARDPDMVYRLEEALGMQARQEPDLVFVSNNGSKVPAHRSVVSMYCPLVRQIFTPPHLTTIIVLPDSSSKSILGLVSIFYTGLVSGVEQGDTKALREIEEAGALLGFQVNLGSVPLPVPQTGEVQISDTVKPKNEKVEVKEVQISDTVKTKNEKVEVKESANVEVSDVGRDTMSSPEIDEEEANVDAELTCRICLEKQKNTSGIWVHYISKHYMKSLKTEFKDLANFANKTCNVCSKESASLNALFIHIGVKHEKLDFLLQRDGYPKLPRRRIKTVTNRVDLPTTVTIDSPKKLLNNTYSNADETPATPKNTYDIDSLTKAVDNLSERNSKINCRLCSTEDLRNKNDYMEHLSSKHYWTELVESFGNKYTKVCILCKAKRNSLQELAIHIGVFHKIAEDYIPKPTEPSTIDVLDLTGGGEDEDNRDWESRILENSKKIKETGKKLKRKETYDFDVKRRRGI